MDSPRKDAKANIDQNEPNIPDARADAKAIVLRHIKDGVTFEVAVSPDLIKVYTGVDRETVIDVSRNAPHDVIEAEIAAQLRRAGLERGAPS
jgi:hypothetical protein